MSPQSCLTPPARRSGVGAELANLHRSALPRLEQVPEVFDMAYWARPTRAIGGDLLAAWPVGEKRLLVCLADVMGHGVPAAIVASAVRAGLYQMKQDQLDRPALILNGINRLVNELFDSFFVTASVCLFETSGKLSYAQAGHPPMMLRGRQGGVTLLSPLSPPLGMELDAAERCIEQTVTLESGTSVVLYTDGITDALASPEITGTAALSGLVANCRKPTSFRLVQRIRRAVERCSPIRHDDRTALAVRILAQAFG